MSLRHEWKRGGMNIDLEDVAKASSICSQSRYDVRNRHKQDIRKACIAKIHEEKRLTPTSLPEEYKHGCTVLAAIKYTKWPPSPNHSYPNREVLDQHRNVSKYSTLSPLPAAREMARVPAPTGIQSPCVSTHDHK